MKDSAGFELESGLLAHSTAWCLCRHFSREGDVMLGALRGFSAHPSGLAAWRARRSESRCPSVLFGGYIFVSPRLRQLDGQIVNCDLGFQKCRLVRNGNVGYCTAVVHENQTRVIGRVLPVIHLHVGHRLLECLQHSMARSLKPRTTS